MCRSTDFHGFAPVNRDRLRIRSFVVGLSGLKPAREQPLPQSLTLAFLPRISGAGIEVAGSKIRPDAPAFVPLHRRRPEESGGEEFSFASADRVAVGSGARFEVFLRDEKVLRGVFWRDDQGEWRLELSSAAEGEIGGVVPSAEARVRVSAEGHVAMVERVAVLVPPRRRRFEGLEEIPEEEEEGDDECCCDCGLDGGDLMMEMDGGDEEMDVEGVGWALDVGIWVMCLGVGFLVSKASSKTLRRRRIL